MDTLIWILASAFLVSIIPPVGVVTFSLKEKSLEKILLFLAALSAGMQLNFWDR